MSNRDSDSELNHPPNYLYGFTVAATVIAFEGVVNPAGVSTEITVCPSAVGTNSTIAHSAGPFRTTCAGTFATAGFVFAKLANTLVPGRNRVFFWGQNDEQRSWVRLSQICAEILAF